MTWRETRRLIREDHARKLASDKRPDRWTCRVALVLSTSAMAVLIYRLAAYFYSNNLYFFTKILSVLNIVLFNVEISPRAQIDGGFVLGHAQGVTVHDRSKVGRNCTLMHHSSIGVKLPEGEDSGGPLAELEDDILVGAGARIMGCRIRIGAGCRIGPNAVVLKSMPPGQVVLGIPATAVRPYDPVGEQCAESYIERAPGKDEEICRIGLLRTFSLIRADVAAKARVEGRVPGVWTWCCLAFDPAVLAVVVFRFQSWLYHLGLRPVAKVLSYLNTVLFTVEIGSTACIGKGLVLRSAQGILVNRCSRIGENCILSPRVTLFIGPRKGMNPLTDRVVLGDNVYIGTGARVGGNIRIGNNCILGANTVVTFDVAENSVMAGVPGRPLATWTAAQQEQARNPGPCAGLVPWSRVGFVRTIRLIRQDIGMRAKIEGKRANAFYWLKLLLNPPGLAVINYRLQVWLYGLRLYPFSGLLRFVNMVFFKVDISPRTRFGGGFILAHANGIVIGDHVEIGENCILHLASTLATGPRRNSSPEADRLVLGDNALIGAGAMLIGNIVLGDNVVVGLNSVVVADAPDNAVLVGVPARLVANSKQEESLGEAR
ncbi:MAG: DapH/DapD/GlmU-related protein [Desulfovibrionaceae bacterium]